MKNLKKTTDLKESRKFKIALKLTYFFLVDVLIYVFYLFFKVLNVHF